MKAQSCVLPLQGACQVAMSVLLSVLEELSVSTDGEDIPDIELADITNSRSLDCSLMYNRWCFPCHCCRCRCTVDAYWCSLCCSFLCSNSCWTLQGMVSCLFDCNVSFLLFWSFTEFASSAVTSYTCSFVEWLDFYPIVVIHLRADDSLSRLCLYAEQMFLILIVFLLYTFAPNWGSCLSWHHFVFVLVVQKGVMRVLYSVYWFWHWWMSCTPVD